MNMSTRSVNRAICALFLPVLCACPAFAQRAPVAQNTRVQRPKAAPVFVPNRYILFLQEPPVSARYARREDMQTAAAVAYRQQIEGRQQTLMAELSRRSIRVTGSVSTLLNAIFVAATPDRLAEMRALPGVIGIMPERAMKRTLNKATALSNAPAAWSVVGGQSNAGAGIKIAILDTGIDQTHPAFQDSSLQKPSGFPKCNAQSDCNNFTNNKVIVARSYVPQIAAQATCAQPTLTGCALPLNPTPSPATSSPDDYSARDRDGHGTAVAACAAGEQNSNGSIAFSGMAPKAFLGSYKIFGTDGVNDSPPESVWIQAIEDAVKDGMDVANMSSGGPAFTGALDDTACGNAAGVPCDPTAAAFNAAVQAGLVITAAAGNSGPSFNSIVSPGTAPAVITVGATMNAHALGSLVSATAASAPANLKAIAAQRSDSFFGVDPLTGGCCISPGITAPLVDITTALDSTGLACSALPVGSLTGKVALIQRGTCNFSVKALNAETAGAVGEIFYMADSSTPFNPQGLTTLGASVMISLADGQNLKSYIDSNAGASVTIDTAGQEIALSTLSNVVTANQLTTFSSEGPTPDGLIKPDIVAPGGFDSSAIPPPGTFVPDYNGIYTAAQNYDPNGEVYSQSRYVGADGTSFAAPLVAGAAALVKQAHPTWTPAQIKSALLNYSAQDVLTDTFLDLLDVQELGAGRLIADAAVNATVTAEPATLSFGYVAVGVTPPTIAVKVTNFGSGSVTLAVKVVPVVASTTAVTLDQSSITLAAGANTTIHMSLAGTAPIPGEYSGGVTLTSQTPAVSMRIPYMFIVGDGVPASAGPLFNCCYGAVGTDLGAVPVIVTDQYGVPVVGAPITWTVSPAGGVTLRTVTGIPGTTGNTSFPFNPPACTPSSSTSSVTCPTNKYGIAWVDVVAGSTATTGNGPTLTALLGGSMVAQFGGQCSSFGSCVDLVPAPALANSPGGGAPVEEAGAYGSTVAPGSYMDLFGTYLSDPNFLPTTGSDVETTPRLPLTLDGVTVSLDAPATGSLPAISVPGYIWYVSPIQVNVWVPYELANYPSAQVKLTYAEFLYSNLINVPLATYVPAFFMNSGTIADARDNTTAALITTTNAATAGEVLQLYANGLGPVTNQPVSGDPACGNGIIVGSCTASSPLSATTTPVTVTIGGKQATVMNGGTAFLAPGFVGLYQVNIQVPSGLASGNQPITISVGGKTSPSSVAGSQIVLPIK